MFGEYMDLHLPRLRLHGIDESDSCGKAPHAEFMSDKWVVAVKDGVKLPLSKRQHNAIVYS